MRGVGDELALGALVPDALGDVGRRHEQQLRAVLGLDGRHDPLECEPEVGAIAEPKLLEARPRLVPRLPQQVFDVCEIVRMDERANVAADERDGRVAELALVTGRGVEKGSPGVEHRDELGDVLDDQPVQLAAGGQATERHRALRMHRGRRTRG